MTIVYQGTDGILFFDENNENIIYKRFKYPATPNVELNEILKQIDPERKYFMWYDIINQNIVSMPRLLPLDSKSLTKAQYRHLKKGLDLLHEHRLSHGDLPDNIMYNPISETPVFIDFDHGHVKSSETDRMIDRIGFLSHFKIADSKK